jgi:hypothetical protein
MKRETRRIPADRPSPREVSTRVWSWNRRLHFYLGLYFLLFIWLFSISGLFLNHQWSFEEFWPDRRESTFESPVRRPATDEDLAIARDLMRQLGIAGEINQTERSVADDRFEFQVTRPGQTLNVEASFATGRAEVKEIRVNAYGVMDALHHLTGVSLTDPARQRDWVLTRVWSFSMDAVAVGLLVLVSSGLYLWYRLRRKRRLGLLVLGIGTTTCVFFLFGLGRLF